mmetsp:Transcript_10942/g.26570  ORF Transcript_10942/g.26570 Transcript_10942/m.26570 type:complete len:473 (+) Transcript_10942:347-1765(+)
MRRPHRVRGVDVHAGDPLRADPDDPPRHGRCVRRRQDRGEHADGQEPHRSLPPAYGGVHGHGVPRRLLEARPSARRARVPCGHRRDHQDGRHLGRQPLRGVRAEGGADPAPRARHSQRNRPPLRGDQGGGGDAGPQGGWAPWDPQLGTYHRACCRGAVRDGGLRRRAAPRGVCGDRDGAGVQPGARHGPSPLLGRRAGGAVYRGVQAADQDPPPPPHRRHHEEDDGGQEEHGRDAEVRADRPDRPLLRAQGLLGERGASEDGVLAEHHPRPVRAPLRHCPGSGLEVGLEPRAPARGHGHRRVPHPGAAALGRHAAVHGGLVPPAPLGGGGFRVGGGRRRAAGYGRERQAAHPRGRPLPGQLGDVGAVPDGGRDGPQGGGRVAGGHGQQAHAAAPPQGHGGCAARARVHHRVPRRGGLPPNPRAGERPPGRDHDYVCPDLEPVRVGGAPRGAARARPRHPPARRGQGDFGAVH